MYKIKKVLKISLSITSMALLFIVIGSILKSPNVHAAQPPVEYCTTNDGPWVPVNVFTVIEDSNGDFIKYSSNFTFNIRSYIYVNEPAGAPNPGAANPSRE